MIWLLLSSFAFMVPAFLFPSDWMGWLFVYASFAVVPLFLSSRKEGAAVVSIWAALVAHHAAAITDSYFSHSALSSADAQNFHYAAWTLASTGGFSFGVGAEFYQSALGLLYLIGGKSLFLGEESSVLAFAFSCIIFFKLLQLLEVKGSKAALILLYGLAPALVFFTSYTLRESWQILFFMSTVYFLLRFRLNNYPKALLLAVAAAGAMGMLHNGLIVFAPLLILLGLVWPMGRQAQGLTLRKVAAMALAVTALAALLAALAFHRLPHSAALEAATSGETLEYAAKYRRGGSVGARTEYGVTLDASSPKALVQSTSLLLMYYMLAPFPWQIVNGSDAYAAAEAWFRLLLIFFAFMAWKRAEKTRRQVYSFLLILYFTMTLMWAMGTVNYGTAIRHHIMGNWLLTVLGAPQLFVYFRSLFQRKNIKRKANPAHEFKYT